MTMCQHINQSILPRLGWFLLAFLPEISSEKKQYKDANDVITKAIKQQKNIYNNVPKNV